MGKYRHVLAAVDFTPETRVITEKAREIAELYKSRLSLIHVVEFSMAIYPPEVVIPDEFDMEKRMLKHAKVSLKELAVTHGVKGAKRYVEMGIARDEILRVAEEKEVDLIVIGSHGRHGIQLLLGSTANAVLHHAKCDVLAVRVGSL